MNFNPDALRLNRLLFCFFLMVSLVCSGQDDQSQVEEKTITFRTVDFPPLARKCKEKWEVERQKQCTSKYIQRYFLRKFDTDLVSDLGLQVVHLEVEFVVDEDGKVVDARAYGLHESLREHIEEIARNLPKFRPAIHQGDPASVKLGMVLTFGI